VRLAKSDENATVVSLNICVLLGDVPGRLEPLGKCGGWLLFADEPDSSL